MIERARLTPQLVFEATCPDRGERWIADTKIKGFGLRLWSTKSGGEKAFVIRVSNSASKKVRRTFDISRASGTKLGFRLLGRQPKYGLGDYLEDAREWAQNEIDKIKGRPTVQDENWSRRREAGKLVLALSLESAAKALLAGLETKNASQRYIDQLYKLFALHIPEKIKSTPLEKLNAKQVARALVASKASPGNVRALRSFLSQIIQRGASFHGPIGRFHDEFAEEFAKQWDRHRDVRYPELRRFRPKKYKQLFDALESDKQYWQQAMAIRLYFAFHAPLSRVLSGRWKQIHDGYLSSFLQQYKELFRQVQNAAEVSKIIMSVKKQ